MGSVFGQVNPAPPGPIPVLHGAPELNRRPCRTRFRRNHRRFHGSFHGGSRSGLHRRAHYKASGYELKRGWLLGSGENDNADLAPTLLQARASD
jgi:hypothetical protein